MVESRRETQEEDVEYLWVSAIAQERIHDGSKSHFSSIV
jgi:hypothetical protein